MNRRVLNHQEVTKNEPHHELEKSARETSASIGQDGRVWGEGNQGGIGADPKAPEVVPRFVAVVQATLSLTTLFLQVLLKNFFHRRVMTTLMLEIPSRLLTKA